MRPSTSSSRGPAFPKRSSRTSPIPPATRIRSGRPASGSLKSRRCSAHGEIDVEVGQDQPAEIGPRFAHAQPQMQVDRDLPRNGDRERVVGAVVPAERAADEPHEKRVGGTQANHGGRSARLVRGRVLLGQLVVRLRIRAVHLDPGARRAGAHLELALLQLDLPPAAAARRSRPPRPGRPRPALQRSRQPAREPARPAAPPRRWPRRGPRQPSPRAASPSQPRHPRPRERSSSSPRRSVAPSVNPPSTRLDGGGAGGVPNGSIPGA